MSLSTHVLDTSRGTPAAGIAITVYARNGSARTLLVRSITNANGRTAAPLLTDLPPGDYEIVFAVGAYFAQQGVATFYDTIPIRFIIQSSGERYHVPLLLAPWAYSTYRGS